MSVKIEGKDYPLKDVFSDRFVFHIPKYQRPYSWTTEQALELFDDLKSAMGDAGSGLSELDPYFLGSIVLVKPRDSAPEAEVVDGQQRLTTLTMLLAAIRTSLLREGEAYQRHAHGLSKFLYQEGDIVLNTPNRPRLSLRERDAEFFRRYVQEPLEEALETLDPVQAGLTDAQKNVQLNYRELLRLLDEMPASERFRLAQFVVANGLLVVVSTPDLDSAYRIFSVMNDRGLDLSHTDILKADVIGAIPEDERDRYTQDWEDIEDELGRRDFENLFAHIRTIRRKYRIQDTLLKEFKEHIRPKDQPREFISGTLKPYAEAFEILRGAEYESTHHAEPINRMLRLLGRLENNDWLPPAMMFYTRHKRESAELLRFLQALERLAAYLLVTRKSVSDRLARYTRLLFALEAEGDLFSPSSPLMLSGAEQDEALEALNRDLYPYSKMCMYVLKRLDEDMSEGAAHYDFRNVSIEHVLPQRPGTGSEWLVWFPNPEDRAQRVHRLGNLVLLGRTKNSAAGNFDFERKKRSYFTVKNGVTNFAITTQVMEETSWTPEVLDRRQRQAIQRLATVWNWGTSAAQEALAPDRT